MADPLTNPAFLVDRYTTAVRTGLEFAARRAQAASEFWAALPGLREPQDIVALHSAFWRDAVDDYSAAISGAVTSPPPTASTSKTASAA